MVTPFTEEYEIDEVALTSLVDHLVERGVHGIFAAGTNGEFFTLTSEEKVRIAKIVVKRVDGQVPVFLGTGGISTRETIELSKRVADAGVDAISVITPFFMHFSQEEVYEHYCRLADAVSLPIVLYNIPGNTGVSLSPQIVARLSELPNIVGVKDSSGDFQTIMDYIVATKSDFAVLAGTDSLIAWALLAGATGAIAATANVAPQVALAIYGAVKEDRLLDARRHQVTLNSIRAALHTCGTAPAALKAAMEMAGVRVGPPRPPVLPLQGPERKTLQAALAAYTGSLDGQQRATGTGEIGSEII